MTPDAHTICNRIRSLIVGRGWSETARRVSVDRTSLHCAFPDLPTGRAPSFRTVTEVAASFGLRLVLQSVEDGQHPDKPDCVE